MIIFCVGCMLCRILGGFFVCGGVGKDFLWVGEGREGFVTEVTVHFF